MDGIMNFRSKIWSLLTAIYPWWLRKWYGMTIGTNCVISTGVRFDKTINPKGIHIGNNVWILKGAIILSHDHCRKLKDNIQIDDNCVIGLNAIIMPGVHIKEHTIVGAGAVVTKDTMGHCIVAGNPAKVIKENITLDNYGRIKA